MNRFPWLFFFLLLTACGKSDKTEDTISGISIDLVIKRFDRDFATATPADLPKLKSIYPYLFPEQFTDSVWIARMRDTIQQEVASEVAKQFPGFEIPAAELSTLFKRATYYFPGFRSPEVITLTTDVDYNSKVIYADSLLLIGLDTYLGKDHYFYKGMQEYLKKNFNREQIVSDAATQLAMRYVPYPQSRTFLAQMVYYGKILYVKELLIPFKTDAEKIGYTNNEWEWAVANEAEVWRYFVERNLLFSTDIKLQERFISPAPFSKFYLELDAESPGKIGQYMGWKIVRAYMKNNTVSLQELLNAPAGELFNASRFKPKK